IANKLPQGYATKLPSGQMYGQALLTKTNIYAKLVQALLDGGVDIHYISNITGHGMRKVMRARGNFTYIIEDIFEPQEILLFIQEHANLSDEDIYGTYNMGQDYALFIPEKDIEKAQDITTEQGFESLNAGYIKEGERKVVIQPKNLIYKSKTLDLR
ncbi:MAG: phosphoribosylformylglycinamidine cyclo-ligase, partial [Candidatus Levybacteria bacterium]|nr:phosphoribosylformylglycinamidine cyclo-ligase [Candidatus Levybacteria bacterium]